MRRAEDEPSVIVPLRADPFVHYTIKSTVTGYGFISREKNDPCGFSSSGRRQTGTADATQARGLRRAFWGQPAACRVLSCEVRFAGGVLLRTSDSPCGGGYCLTGLATFHGAVLPRCIGPE